MPKALILDFGRVISAQKPDALFRAYEAELGLAPDTINKIMFDSPYWQQALVGEMEMSAYWQAIGPALNLRTAEAVADFQARYYKDEKINTGVLEIIRRLFGRTRLAILSNHPPGLNAWLSDWGIDRLFDVVVCSGDEGMSKPDPRIFDLTLQRLGLSPPEAVFIDDTEGHVAAARELGMHAMLFTTAERLEKDLGALGYG